MSGYKDESVKIVQITGVSFDSVCGLGDDNKMYYWKHAECKWCKYWDIDNE